MSAFDLKPDVSDSMMAIRKRSPGDLRNHRFPMSNVHFEKSDLGTCSGKEALRLTPCDGAKFGFPPYAPNREWAVLYSRYTNIVDVRLYRLSHIVGLGKHLRWSIELGSSYAQGYQELNQLYQKFIGIYRSSETHDALANQRALVHSVVWPNSAPVSPCLG